MEKTAKWLGRIAHYLDRVPIDDERTGTRDFAWWHLAWHSIDPDRFWTAHVLIVGVALGAVAGTMTGLMTGFISGAITGLVTAIAVVFLTVLAARLSSVSGGLLAVQMLDHVRGAVKERFVPPRLFITPRSSPSLGIRIAPASDASSSPKKTVQTRTEPTSGGRFSEVGKGLALGRH
ncbi:hypothetical protein [Streptomyces sp. NPDC006446]|uniref:hypothetical protein n=1 Tax=Streptomyces sp. NPDC006446 TaxID=3154301 RepID=UPI0033B0F68C